MTLRYVADKPYVGGLVNADVHPYYSFKIVTIGSSDGEDTNTYIYKLAKTYYASLAGRKEGDINNDGAANALDIVRYKRAAAGEDTFLDSHSADVNVDGNRDKTDLGILRKELL